MSPVVAYHATRSACRAYIHEHGLLRSRPTQPQPFGSYVFREDREFDHWTYGSNRLYWSSGPRQDLWQVCYIGPITNDPFVANGLVLLLETPPEHLELVS